MSRVLVPIADGSEEIEAVTIIDVLRRADVEVCVASAKAGSRSVTASRAVQLTADEHLDQALTQTWDMIVLPGGMPGAQHLSEHEGLVQQLRSQLEQGRWVAAICAAPAVVLGHHQLIAGATATCFPRFHDQLRATVAQVSEQAVVVDNNLITSQGPGTAMAFALTLVETLAGKAKAEEVAAGLLFAWPQR